MFRRVQSPIRICVRGFQTTTRTVTSRSHLNLTFATVVIGTAAVFCYSTNKTIKNDAEPPIPPNSSLVRETVSPQSGEPGSPTDVLQTFIWGSNKCKVLSDTPEAENFRFPQAAEWLNKVALRDLAFHKTYAACVDARGDVYQWGEGFNTENTKPRLTLGGKDIVQIQLSESRLYALSSSGKIYVLPASEFQQKSLSPSFSSWWKTALGFQTRHVNFVEIIPKDASSWGEKFTSISAGDHHLLALTSSGRAFAHPITKQANSFGQLGFRKLELPGASLGRQGGGSQTMTVELVPKSVADPYAKSSPSTRESKKKNEGAEQDLESQIDDSSIRFCPSVFEIPSLKGIKLKQLVAGGRTSLALTETGRVLGWGANEYGQLGLGNNVTLDTVTVPTEVALWKSVSARVQSKCLNIAAGGDLTCYTVERVIDPSPATVDVMMCGNGQWGGLGNNVFSNAQGTPVRARNVSELMEYNDGTRTLQAIRPHSVSVSPTGHVLLSLQPVGTDRDLLAWGKNYDSELGNGKKSSMAVPVVMQTEEGGRMMLKKLKAKEVLDLSGRRWKRDVVVEQQPVTGYRNSAVFWKIV
ncbi:RCC1/BLIP-II [Marasmius fiardii PR-910]|nr:RCC1/BLIP-II [Marasmius fiardii PR-910]